MATAEYSGCAPVRAPDQPTTPEQSGQPTPQRNTPEADIGTALIRAVDLLSDVQDGLTAFMGVAADNDSNFAKTAHWMVGKIDADLGHATELVDIARGALRVGDRVPYKQWVEEAQAAAERLKAFVAAAPAEPEALAIENTVRGALSDAVFMLACAQRWGEREPIMEGLRRAGLLAGGVA